jgi:sugar/nucleoside kinase (ribokinase family)/fructoselysine-6-P-deglycase FrlB-like protein
VSFFCVGAGEIVFDHTFRIEHGAGTRYLFSRAGGSVFNQMMNLAAAGQNICATGVGGEDKFGESAVHEMSSMRIDVRGVALYSNLNTVVITQELMPSGQSETRHSFSKECKICGLEQSYPRLARFDSARRSHNALQKTSFFCVDRFTRSRLQLAREYRQAGVVTVVDIGRFGYLRFVPAAEILAGLGLFDIAFMPLKVANSVARRLGFADVGAICSVAPVILLISEGARGITIYDGRGTGSIRPIRVSSRQSSQLVDDAGAGDVFLADLLNASREPDNMRTCSPGILEGWVASAVESVQPALRSIGARGHLPNRQKIRELAQFEGLLVEDIRQKTSGMKDCPFCGEAVNRSPATISKVKTASRSLGAKYNVGTLFRKMLFAVERKSSDESWPVERCRELLDGSGTAYTIGTGGSFAVANFVSLALNKSGRFFAQSVRPYDYIRVGGKSDFVVVVSYSGATKDCAEAIKAALRRKVGAIYLLTREVQPPLASLLRERDVVVSYGHGVTKERGFVSIEGTVVPCAVWTAAVLGTEKITNLAQELMAADPVELRDLARHLNSHLVQARRLEVFGGGFAWPAMLDLESKLVEGGLCSLQLHEVKDFSHGRFIYTFASGISAAPLMVLGVGEWSSYESAMIRALRSSHHVITIKSESEGLLGSLELLIKLQRFIQVLGEVMGRDISRPKDIPQKGLRLYKWNKGLT